MANVPPQVVGEQPVGWGWPTCNDMLAVVAQPANLASAKVLRDPDYYIVQSNEGSREGGNYSALVGVYLWDERPPLIQFAPRGHEFSRAPVSTEAWARVNKAIAMLVEGGKPPTHSWRLAMAAKAQAIIDGPGKQQDQ